MKKLYILLFTYIFIATLSVKAQSLEELFDQALDRSEESYVQLSNTRGAPVRGKVRTSLTTNHLISYLEKWKGVKNVSILLYTTSNDSLNIAHVSSSGKITISTSKHPIKQILEQEVKLTDSFGLNHSNNNRGVSTKKKTKVVPYLVALRETADFLLPPDINLGETEHLIIIPALNIGSLPWAAFPVDKQNVLIEKMSYAVVPSIQDLFSLTALHRNREYKQTFAPGSDGKHTMNFNSALFVTSPTISNDSLKTIFPELPGAEVEVNLISEMVNGSKILNREVATKDEIFREIVNKDLVYFATHGIADQNDPLHKSFLLITQNQMHNPYLTAKEIQDLAVTSYGGIGADLVVLSACQTGLGKAHAGGMIGLARAFHIAGASNIVMSLWNVDDASTAMLMTSFFKYLKEEPQYIQPHGALRSAILDLKKKYPHPRNWAAFSVLGVGTF